MKRKLGFAKDIHRTTVTIESLKGKKKGKYYCPDCEKEVIPKMGNDKVWHFAHKGEDCPSAREKKEDAVKTFNSTLDRFSDKTIPLKEMSIGFDPDIKTCFFCKESLRKEQMLIIREKFVCKMCYKGLDSEKLDMLQ